MVTKAIGMRTFVRELCKQLDILQLHVIHFDTKEYAELHKVSIGDGCSRFAIRIFSLGRVRISELKEYVSLIIVMMLLKRF